MSEPRPPLRNADLPVRAAVGLALILVAGLTLWLGGFAFWLLATIAGLIMIHEWGGLHGASLSQRRLAQYGLMVPLAILSPWAAGPGFLVVGLILGAGFFLASVTRSGALGAGAVYVGIPVLALVFLRAQEHGLLLAFWAMALVWACDIGAYFAGRAIGGPKLAPAISPNKTWAGLIGGVLSAALFAAILIPAGLDPMLVVATPLLAVLAQAGDLYESHLKRRAGVKDSGTILPGHGGVLDRLDGLVPVAPAAALIVLLQGLA
ncbi:phosphatidate cytidylyltransferase [Sphingomonas sp. BE123]|uniref:phosphatidate cytidylyltransferase n=1 Tax=Sphingomonas sp. BE123 TaxID=2817842 RepID=UPI0028549EC1|nr:phosphatidate cytidylyltransferase [Sphingomonas sp. BE123]MDR6850909.1 phosphatidate cytidylyltransferase [Sphingomonas sp. BE123]